jgi:hypothetical protein
MFDFMQYALIFYDFQLILAQMPVPPAPPVWAKTNVALMQRTVKARMSIFAEVRYIAWLLNVFEG